MRQARRGGGPIYILTMGRAEVWREPHLTALGPPPLLSPAPLQSPENNSSVDALIIDDLVALFLFYSVNDLAIPDSSSCLVALWFLPLASITSGHRRRLRLR